MKKMLARTLVLMLALVLVELTLTTQAAPPSSQEPPPRPFPRRMEPFLFLSVGGTEAGPSGADYTAAVPTWSRLTFQSYRDGNWEIYVANGDGSGQVYRTIDSAADIHPRLNRGCTRIVFASDWDGDDYDIYAMNYNGTNPVQLTFDGTDDVFPAWSPDGARIAFESYRDGQAEVYVMNADGSNQTRLTFDGGYDGMPAWSPDGSQIAFVSYRTGGYRIWVMNADGSEQVQLSNQPYSEGPVWSPDGTWIAYDADNDGDGWQELWRMYPSGSNQQLLVDAGANTDAWAGSWSANGQYIAFTRISFIYYQGQWYWTSAYLDAWNSQGGGTFRLSNNGLDWRPDWQTTDIQSPSSSLSPLPGESPGPFTVSWFGSDAGESGLMSYDVQIKDGMAGTWTDWQMNTTSTSASYPGVGGHTYYFRTRARDNAYNLEPWPPDYDAVTTVEARAPMTAVDPLPLHLPASQAVTVRWGGWDPGNSGIHHYDVQLRDGADGTWTDWQMGTTNRSAGFTGTAGHTYFFRSRGADNAQNGESWPSGDGDARATFYTWAIAGTVRDNTGTPVAGAVVTTTPEAFEAQASNPSGHYLAYVAGGAAPYIADWTRDGYGDLPSTSFNLRPDVPFDVTLPPTDNVVLNWGFENGNLGPGDWTPGGAFAPLVTDTVHHTGDYAAVLGQMPELDTAVQLWSGTGEYSWPEVETAMAADGSLHVVWIGAIESNTIYYTRRDADGTWLPTESFAASFSPSGVDLAVADDGTVHAVWAAYEVEMGVPPEIFYAWRDSDGTWSTPQNISNFPDYDSVSPFLAVDSSGTLHVIWVEWYNTGFEFRSPILYRQRDPSGIWSDVQHLSVGSNGGYLFATAQGADDSLHVVWLDIDSSHRVWYIRRDSDGTWGSPVSCASVSYSHFYPQIAVDGSGRAHIAWQDGAGLFYLQVDRQGRCTNPVMAFPGYVDERQPQMVTTPGGEVHIAWGGYHTWRRAGGNWSVPVRVASFPTEPYSTLAVDESGNVYGAWGSYRLYYARWSDAGGWTPLSPMNGAYDGVLGVASLEVGSDVVAHVACATWQDPLFGVWYARTTSATQTGGSAVSQSMTVPITLSTPVLSFLYSLHDASASGGTGFSVQVDDGITSATLLSTTTDSDTWTQRWYDLTPWAGQAVTLSFSVNEVAGHPPCWATLDEVSLGSSYPDLWVSKGAIAALPGEQVVYTVEYGNRGGAAASSVQITDTLPDVLSFVDASPPPLTTTPSLVWDVGDLAGRSEPLAIVITATMSPTATLWTEYTNTVRIEAASPELELHNNAYLAAVFVGRRVYMPLTMRGY